MRRPNREELEARLEELKDSLYGHDRAVIDRVGLTGRPSPEEKKTRSAIVRQINRVRRDLYRLTAGTAKIKLRLVLTLTEEEHQRLTEAAEAEGLSLSQYAKNRLTDI